MSFSGLRKQFNKANQYLSETIGATEPTKLDDEYNEMERKVDVTYELISALVASTNAWQRWTEIVLPESMYKYGTTLGDDSNLGKALKDCSEAYRQMADIKYQLCD
uniref:BAR domain-containing protein n=1 Tax=Panagrellus redivivus TaxID=6233 RepID=A0A7E4V4U2_PANRE